MAWGSLSFHHLLGNNKFGHCAISYDGANHSTLEGKLSDFHKQFSGGSSTTKQRRPLQLPDSRKISSRSTSGVPKCLHLKLIIQSLFKLLNTMNIEKSRKLINNAFPFYNKQNLILVFISFKEKFIRYS